MEVTNVTNMIQETQEMEIVREAPEKITRRDIFWSFLKFNAGVWLDLSNTKRSGASVAESIGFILRKLYKNDDDFKEALSRHTEYYMTEYSWGGCVMGLSVAMEEQRANELYETGTTTIQPEAISAVKASLMGPFAGIGDTLNNSIIWAIALAITTPMALAGNFAAVPLGWFFTEGYLWIVGLISMWLGYSKGREFVLKMTQSGIFANLLNFAGILAMVMFGALNAQLVSFSTPGFAFADSNLTDILNMMIPGVTSLAPVFIIYYLCKVRKISIPKVIIGIVIVCVILGVLGGFTVPA